LAPHQQPPLPLGNGAVYVFSLSSAAAAKCGASENCVLKVGRVGPNSDARFRSQHYLPRSARSNLAASLLRADYMWKQLGIETLSEANVKEWLLGNTDRDHFFIRAEQASVLPSLEAFVRARVRPIFEGV
jgi:hypothetical protein